MISRTSYELRGPELVDALCSTMATHASVLTQYSDQVQEHNSEVMQAHLMELMHYKHMWPGPPGEAGYGTGLGRSARIAGNSKCELQDGEQTCQAAPGKEGNTRHQGEGEGKSQKVTRVYR